MDLAQQFLQQPMEPSGDMPTLENWAAMQQQLSDVVSELHRQRAELVQARGQVAAQAQVAAQVQPHAQPFAGSNRSSAPKPAQPSTFSSVKDSGSTDSWLFSLRLYFEATGTADSQKVPFAVTFLRGSAALWWQSHLSQVDAGSVARIISWDAFSTEFKAQFAPVNSVKIARDAIRGLTQTKGVQEYIDRFQALVLQIPDMSAAEQLDKFTTGLKPAVQEKVEIEDPSSLARAMQIAQRIDNIHHRHQQSNRATASTSAASDGPTPMELGAMRPEQQRGQQQWRPRPHGRRPQLNPRELSRCIGQNRCFACKQIGHSWTNCTSKQQR